MKRPDWDDYFIEIAKVVASRSTCTRRMYGAVIVKDKVIISTGYNGSPRGDDNCVDTGICERSAKNVPAGERYELCVAVHAEQNAIVNGPPDRMQDSTIYIAGFEDDNVSPANGHPCLLCRRMIKNARIEKVVYTNKEGGLSKIDAKDMR